MLVLNSLVNFRVVTAAKWHEQPLQRQSNAEQEAAEE